MNLIQYDIDNLIMCTCMVCIGSKYWLYLYLW
jgi:hypothetical protein